jgi:beta-hydroxyacyl-ACP dehydratase FabZ
MASMDINDIFEVLPHRYPMLLVDRITDSDFETYIIGEKNVTFNEPFFAGHFPGNPVMPGVLQLEAMAQVAGILLNKSSGREGKIAYFTSIDKAKFRRMVKPGDTLRLEVHFIRARLQMAKVIGKAFVEDEMVCEAEMSFTFSKD